MSGNRKPPQARDRVLGAQLRAIRLEHSGLSLEQAAVAAQMSLATMSRIENGRRHITVADVAVLCTIYGAPQVQRAALIEATQAPTQAGWWEKPLPGVPMDMGTLASYESGANAVTDWSITMVPGLLQTQEYAAGVSAANGVATDGHAALWEARERRQSVLPKIDYTAYIHEMALHTPFGGVEALKGQLIHLHRAPERGLGVRVVRACLPMAALTHSWLMLEFPKDEPIVHVELMNSAIYLHAPAVRVYESARQELARASLSSTESRSMIGMLAERM